MLVRVENAEVVWRRVDGDAQDIRVAFEGPAGETLEMTARCIRTRRVRRTVNPSLKAFSGFLTVFFARFSPGYLYLVTSQCRVCMTEVTGE